MGKAKGLDVVTFRQGSDAGAAPKPHVAFVGRSNVGKSSLLNAVLKRKIASVSKSPGRTRKIELYPFRDGYIADLPGYGYAKVGHSLRDKWNDWVAAFYQDNRFAAGTAVLVDGRHPGTPRDLELQDWIYNIELPHAIVLTKWDQVKKSQRQKIRKQHAEVWHLEPNDLIPVSAHAGENLTTLVSRIDQMFAQWHDD